MTTAPSAKLERVDRINQLEAPKIDEECQSILQEQVTQGFELYDSSVLARLKPEVSLFINYVYFHNTVWKDVALPGHKIQNIKFIDGRRGSTTGRLTKNQKILFLVLDVVGRYAIERLKLWLEEIPEEDLKGAVKIFKKTVTLLEKVYKFLDLVNFIVFLKTFKYRNLLERILRIQYSYQTENVARFLDFEYMNRTIIWNVLADFLSFCLPYIRYGFGEMAKRVFFFTTFMGSITMDLEDSDKKCGICLDEHVTMPFYITKCRHKFCYFCIKTYINEHKTEKGEQSYKCPKCRIAFSEIESFQKKERRNSENL